MRKLIPLEFKNQRIITTKVLAEQFGTEEGNIQKNFSNNEKRFTEGKHYYKLEGQSLKEFKNSLPNEIREPLKFAPVLYLWTDRGAARHAKILDTDEAWEVYEELEDTYFKVKDNSVLALENKQLKELVIEQRQVLNDFKRLTEEAKQQYKPSHKMKLDYSKMIRVLTNTDEEYGIVKEWVFANLGYTKWEDACIDDKDRIIDTINTVAKLLSIKRMEQISMFNKNN